eukprot:Gregarina_sp_Poly_1__4757@NODE_253_length_10628_cov_50_063252_g221_i0_p3_GENE_NODE_253_length_10628_cov_50_063252_g221_i0NODE_253_length_10628_cov_50_063252_g221_i0_p3_ORF_typecomplete_len343_score53_52BPL_LplA_LipB/PF03099_19/4_8e09Lip_prot_lig_C/PF10437_9/3_9e02Lip_prot_lig_C/PF10437_9/0_00041DUF1828/PF08861_10/0_19DUF1828/PF08861_10/4_7e03_NODE_253_length_10628_cov_50_063252_g221_i016442672
MPLNPNLSGRPLVVISTLNRIYANLALERILVQHARQTPTLFLWRNPDCVILGRNQNPYSEINLKMTRTDAVDVARRYTGGGCVFQDLGNTIFTFVLPGAKIQKDLGNAIILEALKQRYGINAQATGRNDLTIDDKKFSGSAFQLTPTAFVHHGTIIRDMDFAKMSAYLTPHPMKLQQHGTAQSVRNRVTKLADYVPGLKHEELLQSIVDSFHKKMGTRNSEMVHVDESSAYLQNPEFEKTLKQLKSNVWIYGESLPHSESVWYKSDLGLFEISMCVEKGVVRDIKVFSDALDLDTPKMLEQNFIAKFRGRKLDELFLEPDPFSDTMRLVKGIGNPVTIQPM